MRTYLFEILAVLLLGGGVAFFVETVVFLGRRDYLGALLVAAVGFAVMRVGAELARMALAERR